MMSRTATLLFQLLLTAALSGFPAVAPAGDFTVVTNTAPPVKFVRNGMVSGIAGDLLVEVMRRAGLKLDKSDVKTMPLIDGYELTRTQPDTVCVSLARNSQREEDFKWVGPMYTTSLGFIAKASRHIQLSNVKDAKRFTIATVKVSAPENALISMGFSLDEFMRSNSVADAFNNLSQGKADLLAFPKSPAYQILLNRGINPRQYEMVLEFKTVQLYFAFNKQTDDAVIARLQAALDTIKQPGPSGSSVYNHIMKAYFTPDM